MSKFGWSYPPGAANDPYAPYNQEEDWGLDLEELRDSLKAHDTGRWGGVDMDCTLTGKDADLEPWGQQGFVLHNCTEEKVYGTAHVIKVFAGTDVCLNLEPEIEEDEARMERIHEAFMEQAQEVVCGCSVPGEWDGDSWVMSTKVEFVSDWKMDGTDPDYDGTAQLIVDAANEALRPIVDELARADEILSVLAGWLEPGENGENPTLCADGKPSKYACWQEKDTCDVED